MKILILTRLIKIHINIFDVNRKRNNQPGNVNSVLNSSKDDDDSRGN